MPDEDEREQCDRLLTAVSRHENGAMEELRRWISEQPGYDFTRNRTLADRVPRFPGAADVVTPLLQLLDMGCLADVN